MNDIAMTVDVIRTHAGVGDAVITTTGAYHLLGWMMGIVTIVEITMAAVAGFKK